MRILVEERGRYVVNAIRIFLSLLFLRIQVVTFYAQNAEPVTMNYRK
jgi:hypothetical protein